MILQMIIFQKWETSPFKGYLLSKFILVSAEIRLDQNSTTNEKWLTIFNNLNHFYISNGVTPSGFCALFPFTDNCYLLQQWFDLGCKREWDMNYCSLSYLPDRFAIRFYSFATFTARPNGRGLLFFFFFFLSLFWVSSSSFFSPLFSFFIISLLMLCFAWKETTVDSLTTTRNPQVCWSLSSPIQKKEKMEGGPGRSRDMP